MSLLEPSSRIAGDAAVFKSSMGIVLTNDCQLDKKSTKTVQVCPVVPITQFDAKEFQDTRLNKFLKRFHLPGDQEFDLKESVVDFSVTTTIDKAAAQSASRVCTLSDLGRQGFYAQYIRYLTRWELQSVQCPACEAQFDLSLSMPVRAKD